MTQIAPDVRLHVDAYRDWLAEQHLPVLTGHFVADLDTVELQPWELTGGRAAFIYLEGSEGTSGSYVCEIAPGQSLKPQRHMYEEIIYISHGRGAATVWGRSGKPHNFEWQAGSLFAIPLNARYQLHNASGSQPVRFVAVTTAPLLMNYFHNPNFIFDNPFSFDDRFGDEEDYFSREGRMIDTRQLQANFVPDVRNLVLQTWVERGGGGTNMSFQLSGNTFGAHVSEIAPGNYKKSHRHGGGAHILILSGDGYSLMWPEDGEKIHVDWKPGAFFSPPDIWWHQHLNISDAPARYLAFRWGSRQFSMPRLFQPDKRLGTGKSQIEYEEEEPAIRRDFDAACAAWKRAHR
jgi:quercetin dioxygenase-like cupin family protein